MPDHIPTVKRRARAIEKIFRCYRGDAAMVTDLVRSSITCKTFEALVECLEVIRSDPHTQILQIKNRRFLIALDEKAGITAQLVDRAKEDSTVRMTSTFAWKTIRTNPFCFVVF